MRIGGGVRIGTGAAALEVGDCAGWMRASKDWSVWPVYWFFFAEISLQLSAL